MVEVEKVLNYLEVSFPDETSPRGYAAYIISQMLADSPLQDPEVVVLIIYKDILSSTYGLENYNYLGIVPYQIGDWIYTCKAVLNFIRSEEIKNEIKKN